MSITIGNHILGVFRVPEEVEHKLSELRRAGFDDVTVGMMARCRETVPHSIADTANAAFEQKVFGRAASGARFGLGFEGTEDLPLQQVLLTSIGPAVMAGFLAAPTAIRALSGGILVALAELGMPEREAREIEKAILTGRIIIKVQSPTRQGEAAAILDNHDDSTMHTVAACSISRQDDSLNEQTRPSVKHLSA